MKLEFCLNPDQTDLDSVREGIRSYNRLHLPGGEVHAVGCFAKDENGKIMGGLTGEMFKNTVFVEFLWPIQTNHLCHYTNENILWCYMLCKYDSGDKQTHNNVLHTMFQCKLLPW